MQQYLSHDFHHPNWKRAQLLHGEVIELYARGAYRKASRGCEQLIELLEEVEIQYVYRLKKHDVGSIQYDMHYSLHLVQTHPDQLADDLEGYKDRLSHLTIPHDSWLYRIVYHNLLRLELVCILVVMITALYLVFAGNVGEVSLWYILTLLAVIALGIWLLRMTRHSWGIIGMIVISCLLVLGNIFLR